MPYDRDDYLTTKTELEVSPDNSYNYPSVYQIARFCRYATPDEQALLETVELGDHAWNGSSRESKLLNLEIRRNRLARTEENLAVIRGGTLRAALVV